MSFVTVRCRARSAERGLKVLGENIEQERNNCVKAPQQHPSIMESDAALNPGFFGGRIPDYATLRGCRVFQRHGFPDEQMMFFFQQASTSQE